MKVGVSHGIGDLERDLVRIGATAPKRLGAVVRRDAAEGNRLAKSFASEQHTMHGDEDIEYPPSFTTEQLGATSWEYGPDASIGDGSQASGYEFGSINSPPHFDLARSVDIIGPKFAKDVGDEAEDMFW